MFQAVLKTLWRNERQPSLSALEAGDNWVIRGDGTVETDPSKHRGNRKLPRCQAQRRETVFQVVSVGGQKVLLEDRRVAQDEPQGGSGGRSESRPESDPQDSERDKARCLRR